MRLFHTIRAVLWAFLGVRKRAGYEEDLGKLSPFAIVAVALVLVLLLVGGLIGLVNWVV
ncbi:MAG TPA: DUF2970 domain-containing protein [Ramlibacter sp.]